MTYKTRAQLTGRLISSQRYLDGDKVLYKARNFKRFVVWVYETTLRGKPYALILDGHHNYQAANLAGVEPVYKTDHKKVNRILGKLTGEERERFLIDNVTDSDLYDIETGEIIYELRLPTWLDTSTS